ncbi:bifunctional 4-hydroxy-2-oxoglutarate aldolase/2-dehydro-3-deoxy-phosphogluconate aldolase [Thalassiella azotivora]
MTATALPAEVTATSLLDVSPVVPVVVVDDAADAVPLARALAAGGVRVVEITLRTAAGLDAIQRVAAEVPDVLVGAGTVTTPDQVDAVRRAGARFLVTPGTTDRLLDAALDSGVPVLAGTSTLSEMLRLAERGLEAMKFFPAEVSGGRAYLSAVHGPLPDLRFCPTGGIGPGNAADYLALPNVGCVGGSWLTPRDAVRAGDWDRVTDLARAACALRTPPRP